jgi:hypothetical protein
VNQLVVVTDRLAVVNDIVRTVIVFAPASDPDIKLNR